MRRILITLLLLTSGCVHMFAEPAERTHPIASIATEGAVCLTAAGITQYQHNRLGYNPPLAFEFTSSCFISLAADTLIEIIERIHNEN